jgi:hypothetical protein
MTAPAAADVVAKYRRRVLDLLVTFGDEVLDAVRDAKGVNVEDVRTSVLGPLRVHGSDSGDADADDLLAAMLSFDSPVAGAQPSGNASGSNVSVVAATIMPS